MMGERIRKRFSLSRADIERISFTFEFQLITAGVGSLEGEHLVKHFLMGLVEVKRVKREAVSKGCNH
jgi:hypothetical protein